MPAWADCTGGKSGRGNHQPTPRSGIKPPEAGVYSATTSPTTRWSTTSYRQSFENTFEQLG